MAARVFSSPLLHLSPFSSLSDRSRRTSSAHPFLLNTGSSFRGSLTTSLCNDPVRQGIWQAAQPESCVRHVTSAGCIVVTRLVHSPLLCTSHYPLPQKLTPLCTRANMHTSCIVLEMLGSLFTSAPRVKFGYKLRNDNSYGVQ